MSMRTIAMTLVTALTAGMALAQNGVKPPPTPDYSRPTLMRLFVVDPQTSPQPRFDFDVGAVTVRRHGMNLILGYLPFLPPFPGSVPTTTQQMVDPFAMTHTEYAMPARIANRARERELRRIERLGTKGKAGSDEKTKTDDSSATVKTTPP